MLSSVYICVPGTPPLPRLVSPPLFSRLHHRNPASRHVRVQKSSGSGGAGNRHTTDTSFAADITPYHQVRLCSCCRLFLLSATAPATPTVKPTELRPHDVRDTAVSTLFDLEILSKLKNDGNKCNNTLFPVKEQLDVLNQQPDDTYIQ